MPTFLVTRKMPPELAARVRASVEGRRAAPGARFAPRAVSLVRLAIFTTIVGAVAWLALARQEALQQVESERSALLERVRRESAGLTDADKAVGSRVRPLLARSAGNYAGDLVPDGLRAGGALAAITARPMIYVRGPLSSFRDQAGLAESASASFKDAFVLCLVEPPASRTEKLLRAKARAAYAGLGRTQAAAHVQRLHAALEGMPFFAAEWEARVTAARGMRELAELRQEFERAPIEAAKRAARAELLLYAMDEPGDPRGPTELDGERPHDVRVGIVDLASGKPLLRLRRRVDPEWISPAVRAEYASGIDSCSLSLDVYAAVNGGGSVRALP